MTTFVSHVFAELQRVDVTRRHSLGLLPENVRKRKPLPGNTRSSEFSSARMRRPERAYEELPEGVDKQEVGMKKIAERALELRTLLFEKMSQIKRVRYPALSIWLGVYSGELPSSLVPILIRRRRI
jgi:hypothetical protein